MFLQTGILFNMAMFIGLSVSNLEQRQSLQALQEFVLGKILKTVPPFSGNDSAINVTMWYYPTAIIKLDSANEVLSVASFLQLLWQDETLIWHPENYSQHQFVEINSEDIWTPKVKIAESVTTFQPLTSRTPVIVQHQGIITYQLSDIFHTRCKINVAKYPFDEQVCNISFVPLSRFPINLQNHETNLDLNLIQKNGEWTKPELKYTLIEVWGKNNRFAGQYSVSLRRENTYHIVNVIFPMMILSILNPFVFLIPARSGEKLAFLMAVFVSHAVFLNLIHQSMPPTSDAVSYLAMFLALVEVQGFLTILATIVVLCVHHRKEKKQERQQLIKENSQEVKDVQEQLVEVKARGRLNICCPCFSLERFLDGLFFVISLVISLSCCVILLVLSRHNTS